MRRAFTMLELVLAMSMASMVGVGAFAVLNMMNRGDRTLESRSTQVRELATLHGLLQDALGSLVMSNAQRPDTNVGGESLDQDLEGLMEFGGIDDDQPVRPRMILRADSSGLALSAEGRNTPQSFELVLRDGIASYNEPEGLSDAELAALQRGREAVRGVLELRPEGSAWALWWRPVDEHGGPIRDDHESHREQSALRLCGGLNGFQWKAFYRGDRLLTYMATWSNDLPAYFELEVSTTTGLYASWMFEVGWTTAAETREIADEGAGANADGGDAAASGGAGGGATDGGGSFAGQGGGSGGTRSSGGGDSTGGTTAGGN